MAASMKTVAEFMDALQRMNTGPADSARPVALDGDAIKSKVAEVYDEHANRTPSLWNWGMNRADLHRELSASIRDYDKCAYDGYSEQLYYYVLKQVPRVAGKPRRILEIGCGAGFGLNFLSRLEPESRFVGLDLSAAAARGANQRFSRGETLRYVQGDAEKLPFGDNEFDVVINVESSHNYPSLGRFYAEVARVLRPGGHFSYVDLFTKDRIAMMRRARSETDTRLHWLQDDDISEGVKASITPRMVPNSSFRKFIRQQVKPPLSWMVEPIVMRSSGSDFINYNDGFFVKLMHLVRKPTLEFHSYRHGLATKPTRTV